MRPIDTRHVLTCPHQLLGHGAEATSSDTTTIDHPHSHAKRMPGNCSHEDLRRQLFLGGLRQLFQLGHIGLVDAMDDTALCPLHAQECLNASGQVAGDMILVQKENEVSTMDVMVLRFLVEQCHSCCNFREKRGKKMIAHKTVLTTKKRSYVFSRITSRPAGVNCVNVQ